MLYIVIIVHSLLENLVAFHVIFFICPTMICNKKSYDCNNYSNYYDITLEQVNKITLQTVFINDSRQEDILLFLC